MLMRKIDIIVLILVIVNSLAIFVLVADNYDLISNDELKLNENVKHTVYIGLGDKSDNETYINNLKSKIDEIAENRNVQGYTLFTTEGYMVIDNKTVKQKTLVYVFDRLSDDELIPVLNDVKGIDNSLILFIEKSKVSAGVYE